MYVDSLNLCERWVYYTFNIKTVDSVPIPLFAELLVLQYIPKLHVESLNWHIIYYE